MITTEHIAACVFWLAIVSIAIFIYQAIILPGIRLTLRYRVFALRDRIRDLVIEEKIRESDPAFELVHERLNFMCVSLSRFDLARAVLAAANLNAESRARVDRHMNVVNGSIPEVQEIYKESLSVIMQALVFNSMLLFLVGSLGFFLWLMFSSALNALERASIRGLLSLVRLSRDLFSERVNKDTQLAFFSPELATV